MLIIMGVNLRNIVLVRDFRIKFLKGLSFFGLFLLLVSNAYGQPPSGYSVGINQDPINISNENAVDFTFVGAEVDATYEYTFTSSGGGGSVSDTGTIVSGVQIIPGIDLSTLPDGLITLTASLTNIDGTGADVTDTATKDTAVPSGYSVTIDQNPINTGNENAVSFTFAGAEVGATYNYSFTSTGGGTPVTLTGGGPIVTATDQITGIDLSGLGDGTITLSVTLTDSNGNPGIAATDTASKDATAPAGYSVTIDQDPINTVDENSVSFTFAGAEVGATYNYTFTTSGGGGSVTGSGTVGGAGQTIPGIDLSGLADGTITLNVTLTDINGNLGTAATDTSTKDTAPPTGYTVTIDQDPINTGNENAISFTFSGAEVGATYDYSFTTSGGGGSETGSGTVAGAAETISGIDLSGLADGTITLSVTLTNINGVGLAATDTSTKDTTAPAGYSVTINQDPINALNENGVSFTFSGAEVGATYDYSFTTSGGGGSVTGSGTVGGAAQTISGINLSGLADGTITLSVTLTDSNGNLGIPATDTSIKNTAVPEGYSVTINQDPINAGNQNAVSFTFTGAEVGATYNYSFTSSGGGGSITGSGTVANAGQTISGINLSTLPDGTITLSVTLSNLNGTGVAATDTSTKIAAQISINNISQVETNSGITAFSFTVSIVGGENASNNIGFTYNTVNGTATLADNDYAQVVNGTGTISIGNSSTTLIVNVIGDLKIESDETFFVNLSAPINATIADGNGQGIIQNDDGCAAGTSAPVLNAGVPTELCDSTGQDLDAYTNTPAPPNSVLTWSTNSNPLNTGAHLPSSVVTDTDRYYGFFYDALNACASPVLQIDLQFDTTPSAGTTSDTAACNRGNDSVTRVDLDDFITGEDEGSWAWTSGPAEVDPDGGNRVQFEDEDIGTYVYTYTTNTAQGACPEATSTVTITVTACEFDCDVAPPSINPDIPTAFCDEIDPALSLDDYTDGTAPTGTILVWSRNPNPTDPDTDHLSQAEIDNPTIGTYYTFFYATDDLCWSPSSEVTLNVNSTPVITATTGDTFCDSGQAVLTVEGEIPNSANAPNFNWYATETSTVVLSNSNTYNTPVLTETTSFWVEATANGCTSAREEVIVTVNLQPSPGTPANGAACNLADNGATTIDLDSLLTAADPGTWAITTDPSGGSVVIDSENIVDFNGLADGSYVFTYTTSDALPPCTNQSVDVTVVVTDCSTPSDTDLEITKTVNIQNVQIGQEVIFTVTVNNLSDSPVLNVIIRDTLQSGFEYISESTSLGIYDNVLGEWTIGELLPLESATLDITAVVLDQGDYSNTATLVSSLPADTNDTNNEDSVTLTIVPPQEVNLLIEKTVESPNPLVGEEVVFTIVVTNQTLEGTVSQIIVEDIIPDTADAEFVYVSHTASIGEYTRATGLWEIPGLLLNQQATLQITVSVPREGIWGNTATIISPPLLPGLDPAAFARVNVSEPTNTEPGFLFNQFSPNGDGTNDLLKINNLEDYPNNFLQIFDRYGNKILDVQGMTEGNTWDGTRNGEQVPSGTYYYVLDLGDGSEIRKGWIQLIR
ncbi:gliding motility-associated C-terminal domain-containing protein [uncultured Eudoraea sp.]|uniref:T9SS type B sorting domain-containing protein n=1 Tax=uncultured Eudoraea sp. TaxID=1035614 RepID=UPI002624F5BE|nr:gliding motility-associated C-terminal domain-containing protein [uncultured Eudoraea sp.]